MIFRILRLVLCIAGVYVALAAGCEYRSFRGGHRYIRAFRAKTLYQHFFTLLQCEKDIHGADMGKLTYLGYTGHSSRPSAAGPVSVSHRKLAFYGTGFLSVGHVQHGMGIFICFTSGSGWTAEPVFLNFRCFSGYLLKKHRSVTLGFHTFKNLPQRHFDMGKCF